MLLADKAAHDEQINNKHMQYMMIFHTENYNQITKTIEGEKYKITSVGLKRKSQFQFSLF